MDILHLNTFDIEGGAARAAYRLHSGLNNIGLKSRMLVQHKAGDDSSVVGPVSKMDKLAATLRAQVDPFALRTYKRRQQALFSPSVAPNRIVTLVKQLRPDIVHLHWINWGFVPIERTLAFEVPTVWTLHDMWPFTGGCHYDDGCGRFKEQCGNCPILASNREHDLSRRVWERKNQAWRNGDLTIVTPSRWLGRLAKQSSLFKDTRVEVIPNGIDTSIFRPIDKAFARDALRLPRDKKLILFGALASTSDPRKGFQFIQPALQALSGTELASNVELVVFGASRPSAAPDFGLPAHFTGRLNDDVSLALLLSAADVFIAPSTQENLSNTVLEALACGTPCVAFRIGGMEDLIEDGETGYLATPFSPSALAEAVVKVLQDEPFRLVLGMQARRKVENEFNLPYISRRHADLYSDLIR